MSTKKLAHVAAPVIVFRTPKNTENFAPKPEKSNLAREPVEKNCVAQEHTIVCLNTIVSSKYHSPT